MMMTVMLMMIIIIMMTLINLTIAPRHKEMHFSSCLLSLVSTNFLLLASGQDCVHVICKRNEEEWKEEE